MNKCGKCGADNPSDNKYCGNCGAPLPQNAICGNCGAALREGAAFCGKCGAPVGKRCASCGVTLPSDSAFCYNCGAAVNGVARNAAPSVRYRQSATVSQKPSAPKKTVKQNVIDAKNKVAAFEKKHCVIINGIIAALALVFIFVALFAPVKMTAYGSVDSFGGDVPSDAAISSDGASCEIDQSIWQIFGSIKYISLDINEPDGIKLIEEMSAEVAAAQYKISVKMRAWEQSHPYATEEEQSEKYSELCEEYMSDVNYLGYQFVMTAVGALDYITGEEVEAELNDMLIAERCTAIVTLVMALITAVVQIAIAVASLIFLIFAVIGIVRKKQSRLFAFLTSVSIVSGAGLAALSAAPQMSAGGAMFAVALTVAIAFLLCATGKAVMADKNILFIVKRAICSTLVLTAFFMLCSDILSMSFVTNAGIISSEATMRASLGMSIEAIANAIFLRSIAGASVCFSDLSVVSSAIVLAIGTCAFILLFVALIKSLLDLANHTDKKPKFDVFTFISVVILIAFAVTPAILSAADKVSYASDYDASVTVGYAVRAYVYVAMAFATAAFVFELVYRPCTGVLTVPSERSVEITPEQTEKTE